MVGSGLLVQLIKAIGSKILPYGLARSSSGSEASGGSATSSGGIVLAAETILLAAPAVRIYLTVHEQHAAAADVRVGKEGELGVMSNGSEGARPPPPTPAVTFLAPCQTPWRCPGDS